MSDPAELRRVFAAFPSGVTAVAALVGGRPVGLTASSFTSVSLDPPLVSVCIAHTSTTWPVLSQAPRCGISVLSAGQEPVCRQLAERRDDRFVALGWHATTQGAVVIDEASAWLECSRYEQVRVGDHDIVVLQVHEADVNRAMPPLVFHRSRYRRLEEEVTERVT